MTQEDTGTLTTNDDDDEAIVAIKALEREYREKLAKFKADKTNNKDLRRERTAAKRAWDLAVLNSCLAKDKGAQQLRCKDCSHMFIWTTEEQDYYTKRDWKHKPLRCKQCIERSKTRRNSGKNTVGKNKGDTNTNNFEGETKTSNGGNKNKAGKNMCYAFQRGECIYGDKCKFNHDPEFSGKKSQDDDNGSDSNSNTDEHSSNKRKNIPDDADIPFCKWGKDCRIKRCRFRHREYDGNNGFSSAQPTSSSELKAKYSVKNNVKDEKKNINDNTNDSPTTTNDPPSKKSKMTDEIKKEPCFVDQSLGDLNKSSSKVAAPKEKSKHSKKKKGKTVLKAMKKELKKAPGRQLKTKVLRKLILQTMSGMEKGEAKTAISDAIVSNKEKLVLLEDGKIVKLV